jgi:Helix-turn-helix domain/Bacterial regulatory proteins, gntR family
MTTSNQAASRQASPHQAVKGTSSAARVPRFAQAAGLVVSLIQDGTLRPGQPAPSGAELSRVTGFSTMTCRRSLRLLIKDGVLTPGPSARARPRVASPAGPPGSPDAAEAIRELSSGLATRRRTAGLTQPQFASLVGFAVTTIGHAETGRLWQSRRFWEQSDAVLGADGALLALHDAYRAATCPQDFEGSLPTPAAPPSPAPSPLALPPSGQLMVRAMADGGELLPVPVSVTLIWSDGTATKFHPD